MVNPPVAVVEVYKIISHHLSLRMAYCYSTNNNLRGAPGAPLTIGHQGWRRSQLAMSGGSSGTQTHLFLWNIGMPIMPMLQSHHVIFPVQSVWKKAVPPLSDARIASMMLWKTQEFCATLQQNTFGTASGSVQLHRLAKVRSHQVVSRW